MTSDRRRQVAPFSAETAGDLPARLTDRPVTDEQTIVQDSTVTTHTHTAAHCRHHSDFLPAAASAAARPETATFSDKERQDY